MMRVVRGLLAVVVLGAGCTSTGSGESTSSGGINRSTSSSGGSGSSGASSSSSSGLVGESSSNGSSSGASSGSASSSSGGGTGSGSASSSSSAANGTSSSSGAGSSSGTVGSTSSSGGDSGSGSSSGGVPAEWVCDPDYYDDFDCDCGCGVPDPTCEGQGCAEANCTAPACAYCYDVGGVPLEECAPVGSTSSSGGGSSSSASSSSGGVSSSSSSSSSSGGGGCTTLAEARALPAGAVDVTLCAATVTYVYGTGFFLQGGQAGPAVSVYAGNGWTNPDAIAVGDVITLHATDVGAFNGTEQIEAFDGVSKLSTDNVDALVQDLSAGTLPSEDLEAELVELDGTVTAINGNNVTISYGSASGVTFRVSTVGSLCVGATFTVRGVVTEWSPDGIHRIQSYNASDVTGVNTAGCGGGAQAPVAGDLVLNEFLEDPPGAAVGDLQGDANCDGARDANEDEFVELVNVSTKVLDLTGVTVSDSAGVDFTFPASTTVPVGGVVVVYGGGTPACPNLPSNVQVFADAGGFGFNNDGDTIRVLDASSASLIAHTYANDVADQSYTRDPDLTGNLTGHSGVTAANGALFSPGKRVDGTSF
ncbi:MAG: lamin tail domain-containing protein [Myxococcota bacterium]